MKKLLLLLIICSIATTFKAQTIHWMTFIDTDDVDVGKLDVRGREVLYSKFINVINAALNEKGVQSDVQDYYGNRLTPENCKRAVQSLTCQPEDIVVFYYIGHGGRPITDSDEDHPYPQMWMGQKDERKMIPLEWVHNTLKSKNARLTVTIGMCCNVKQGLTIKRAPAFGVNYGGAYLSDIQLRSIQQMFLGHQGDFILSSATPGQSSVGASTPLGDMDLFTAVLALEFENASKQGNLAWNSLFTQVKGVVNQVTGGSQTPIFTPNVEALSSSSITGRNREVSSRRQQPQKGQLDISNPNEVGNRLMQCIDFMIDINQPLEERRKVSDMLREIFSSDAIIKIEGQDGKQVIDKEKIDVFLTRLSSSRIILKIVPSSYKYANHVITELRIKEYYKKN